MNEAIRQRFFDSVLCGYKRVAILLICTAVAQVSYAGSAMHNEHLVEAPINLQSKISLQRGAQIFANNCVGCHSARFMRYERVAQDLSIPKEVMVENFLVGDMTIGDVMRSAMAEEDAKKVVWRTTPGSFSYCPDARAKLVVFLFDWFLSG